MNLDSIKARVAALEQGERTSGETDIAARMEAAGRRLRALSPEQREAQQLARLRVALVAPEPEGEIAKRLWRADRRLARFAGLDQAQRDERSQQPVYRISLGAHAPAEQAPTP